MTLSDQQIRDFIRRWQQDFGETLSPERARAEAVRLLDFFAALAQALRRQRSQARDAPPKQ